MIFTEDLLNVIKFDVSGFLALQKKQEVSDGSLTFLQENKVSYVTQWQIAVGYDLAILEITAVYEPISKLDFSKLATFKVMQTFKFANTNNLTNEKEIISKVAQTFNHNISREYNKRIENTIVKVPFPIEESEQINQFTKEAILSFHRALQKFGK